MEIVYFLLSIIYITNSIDGMMLFDGEQHLESETGIIIVEYPTIIYIYIYIYYILYIIYI